jgi:hypothetical protein
VRPVPSLRSLHAVTPHRPSPTPGRRAPRRNFLEFSVTLLNQNNSPRSATGVGFYHVKACSLRVRGALGVACAYVREECVSPRVMLL